MHTRVSERELSDAGTGLRRREVRWQGAAKRFPQAESIGTLVTCIRYQAPPPIGYSHNECKTWNMQAVAVTADGCRARNQ